MIMNITESLRARDLRHFVNKVFEVDSYQSKIGNDHDVVVLSFTVTDEDPAKDLENFIEMGYTFVLDADVSPGETDDSVYIVFVELERTTHVAEQIREILDGIEKVADITDFRFRYYKSFNSQEATIENLESTVPTSPSSYSDLSENLYINNFSNFFVNSYTDTVSVLDESITFKRIWKEPLTFNIINSGSKADVYKSVHGPIMLENNDIAEVMYLTKSIGNYNITKISNTFIFENNGWAVALEKK